MTITKTRPLIAEPPQARHQDENSAAETTTRAQAWNEFAQQAYDQCVKDEEAEQALLRRRNASGE